MQLRFKIHSTWQRKLSSTETRWWFLRAVGFRVEIHRDPVWDFAIYWKPLLAALLLLTTGGYLAGVTALHLWWARQPEMRVAWSDIALAPLDWQKFRERRGDRMIALGQTKLAQGKIGEAAFDLQTGLSRSPRNIEGRIALARVWAMMDQGRALAVIGDGRELMPDHPELLRAWFDLYALMGAEQKALDETAALLAPERRPVLSADARRAVVDARAALLLERQPDEAWRLLASLPRDLTSRESWRTLPLMLRALRKLGRGADALALLAQVPANPARGARLDAEFALAAGDDAAFESAMRRLKADASESMRAALFAIQGWHELKRPTLRQRAVEEFFRFYGANEQALHALGSLAIELDLPLLLTQTEQEAGRHRFNPFAFQVHETELALRHGDLTEARRRFAGWEGTLAELPESQRVVPELFARLLRAAAVNGEAQNAALTAHLTHSGRRLSPSRFKLVLRTLERGGNLACAGQVADIAVRFMPMNEELQAEQQRLAERIAQQKSENSRPTAPVAAVDREDADQAAFENGAAAVAAIDAALSAGDSARALRVIHAVRKAEPGWLSEIEPALGAREFRARRTQGEMPSAMIAFRGLALKVGAPRAAAFHLVRELIGEGDGELALQLAREIVRLVPGERAAAVLLKEAEAAAPAPATPTERSDEKEDTPRK